ncbi:hypothetical protein RvY_00412-2 [Ramazzottius varieornatus]|nr:hypothetical protein RvY_00412-2 [Ramazzottius varieornatus]
MGQRMMMLCVVVAMLMAGWTVTGTDSKSIIREMLQERMQFLPDGRAANRPGRQFEDMPIERCRVTQNKELTTKLNRLCDECFQIYRVPNFYMKCR